MKTMPAEVRQTVRAYLDGKIQQEYAREDGRGVVFILNAAPISARFVRGCPTADEASAPLTETLGRNMHPRIQEISEYLDEQRRAVRDAFDAVPAWHRTGSP